MIKPLATAEQTVPPPLSYLPQKLEGDRSGF